MSALLPLLPLLLLAGPAAAYRYDACEFQGNRFRCLGRCIGRDFVCDGAPDCDDKSDERRGCYECSPRAFRCDNKCFSLAKRCDGTEHCSDGSDEKGCPAKSSRFTCGDGSTVATSQVCDGYRDCLDDEAGCTACRGGAFFCGRRCVPPGRVCDGYRDCEAGEDERDCAPGSAGSLSGPEMAARLVLGSRVVRGRDWKWGDADGTPPGRGTVIDTINLSGWVTVRWPNGWTKSFRMGNASSYDLLLLAQEPRVHNPAAGNCPADRHSCNGRCIRRDFVCDGAADCDDTTDELHCGSCSTRAFPCERGECLFGVLRCDGVKHCPGGLDEQRCPAASGSARFKCQDNSTWPDTQVCDGYWSCPGGEDEDGCTACQGGAFLCDGKCQEPSRLCDGFWHCEDGEDERDCAPAGSSDLSGPEMAARLVLGSRVARGRDWKWGDVDGVPPGKGTVTKVISLSGWAGVRWDSGKVGDYRMGNGSRFDLRLLTEEPPVREAAARVCPPSRHSCGGRCIARDFVCDGLNDCTDGSDESHCDACSARAVRCENGQCIYGTFRCDGYKHCSGGADEKDCEAKPTGPRFTCNDNSTMLTRHVCDGYLTCGGNDAEDETSCSACQAGAFLCGGRCLLPSRVCDGYWDCPKGEDESDCESGSSGVVSGPEMAARLVLGSRVVRADAKHTPLEKGSVISWINLSGLVWVRWDSGKTKDYHVVNASGFELRLLAEEPPLREATRVTCQGDKHSCGGRCIARDFVCDGLQDCNDGSDELHCDKCSPRAFRCVEDGECINGRHRCDGLRRCAGGSDEKQCPFQPNIPRFACNENHAVGATKVCDGYWTCPGDGGEDEAGCTSCQGGAFFCAGGCKPPSRVCDGFWDCPGGEDERDCTPDGRGTLNGPEMASRLVRGSRVERGRDWKWGDVDGTPPGEGTVVNSIGLDGWVSVRWDSGALGSYRMGNASSFDLRLLTEKPPVIEVITNTCPGDSHGCDGRCIALDFVCDGVQHCNDSSDELHCSVCSRRAFQCEDGECIDAPLRCDGSNRCYGASDEKDCPTELDSPRFTCKDNTTWSTIHVCNGYWACQGREDEAGCTACQGGAFFCDGVCFDPSTVCDGYWDCVGGEDEQDCAPDGPGSLSGPQTAVRIVLGSRVARGRDWKWGDVDGTPPGEGTVVGTLNLTGWVAVRWDSSKVGNYRMGNASSYDLRLLTDELPLRDGVTSTCPPSRHSCGGRCMARDFVCDGLKDCTDGSDEMFCDECSPRAFWCEFDGACLDRHHLCDGEVNCIGGVDEKGCPAAPEDDTHFTCKENKTRPGRDVCNGSWECRDGGDEVACTACQGGAFFCDGICRAPSRVCDGYRDCRGGEDEWDCTPNGPGSLNGPTMAALLFNSSRVVRGKDWIWGESRGRGTVTSPINLEGWVQVTWDSGTDGIYRMGYAGRYDVQPLTEDLYLEGSCGRTNTWTPLVVNGQEAPLGAVPWHAGLYHHNGSEYTFYCGASLLNERYLATAAHCVSNPDATQKPVNEFGVALGKVFSGWNDDPSAVHGYLKKIIPSPNYYGSKRHYSGDVALLQLKEAVKFGSYIAPICLKRNVEMKDSETIQVLGWGSGKVPHQKLASVGLHYKSEATCIEYLKNLKGEGALSYVAADKFCGAPRIAEDSGRLMALAQGDSGGGAVINRDGVWFLIGVVSIRLPNKAMFGFTNMTLYYDWMMKTIKT